MRYRIPNHLRRTGPRTDPSAGGVERRPSGYSRVMPSDLHVELPAEPGAAGRSRRATGRWLAAVCGADEPCDTVSDLVLAVNEAVSNSIEHAYRDDPSGTVVLHADAVRGREGAALGCPGVRVTVRVTDRGAWREPATDPGHRGRGLSMIRACAEDVVVAAGSTGTTVTFHGRLGCGPGVCRG